MIIGIILRNFKTYKNINYIPLSNGESFSGFIGANGIGKSSILEALDCFFNNRPWNMNINRSSSGEESCYIVPIFCIAKDKVKEEELKQKAEIYSNIIWNLMTLPLTPNFINSNFKEFIEQIKKHLPTFTTKDTHYLLPLGEINKDHKVTHSIFRGETLLNPLGLSTEMTAEQKYEYLAQNFLIPLKNYIKESYNYIYIPKDIEPERITRFETLEIQTLLGEKLENIVAKFITQKQIQEISNGLKGFINTLSDSLPSYKFRAASSNQPNLKPSIIYSLIIRDFFSIRELHKEGVDSSEKDLSIKLLSSGEKQQAILSLIHNIIANYRDDSSSLILAIDEPESSLHISACYEQFEKLYQISRKCSQVLFTSHWYGFIPSMASGNIINIVFHSDKHQCLMFDISRYREEIKIKEKEYRSEHRYGLPLDIMLKSSNDFIQSILSSIIAEIPYNWLICEGSSEQFYFNYYFDDEIQNNRLRIVPVGGAKEIKKIYNHLAVSYDELKEKIRGTVILLMDTDEQLLEFETKDYPKLHCYRIINKTGDKTTDLVQVSSNPKAPKTEIEDILNGNIFNETLNEFKSEYPELLDFVNNQEKPQIPSYFAMDLTPSQNDKMTHFFDDKPENKVRFAQKYIDNAKILETSIPSWVTFLKEKLK
ncbi:AAA family ATPase [Bacteroides intestinalis]|jgi:predicted ATP-dependent endonuclease of OLD family|nr:AAA family ATPase [Bacteroides intestinalis]RHE84981.1 ATP-binding protein [Bacteroides intestinalis]